MDSFDGTRSLLARSHGSLVVASDGLVGEVETPLFPPDADEPDYLLVNRQRRLRSRRPVVPVALVRHVTPGVVFLRATSDEVDRLPEHLPIAI
jgi:hypothetical protein